MKGYISFGQSVLQVINHMNDSFISATSRDRQRSGSLRSPKVSLYVGQGSFSAGVVNWTVVNDWFCCVCATAHSVNVLYPKFDLNPFNVFDHIDEEQEVQIDYSDDSSNQG
jgi:hypothetical protein